MSCRGRKELLAVDTPGFALCERMVTGAGASDRAAGREVLARARERHPHLVLCWADGGYASKAGASFIPWARENTGIEVVAVRRSDEVKGFRVLPWRWVAERTSAWIAAHRRVARDYERLAECSQAMTGLAMIDVMAARLAGGTTWRHWRDMVMEPPVMLHREVSYLRNTLSACCLTSDAWLATVCRCCPAGGRGVQYRLAGGCSPGKTW